MTMEALPDGWRWRTVQDVGDVQLGRQRAPRYHDGPNMRPYLRVANVFEDRIDIRDIKKMDFSDAEFERYRLHPGDVLLNEGQTPELLGRPAMYRGIPEEVAFTNSIIRFRAGPDVDPRWALLVFRRHMHFGRFTRESRITTNIAHLSAARFKTVEFPVPPIEEQRRIVDLLEEHLSRLDAADAGLRALEGRLAALRLGTLVGIRADLLQRGVALRRLGDVADTALGKMLDAKKANGTPTPYLRNINVRWGLFDLRDIQLVPLTESERERFTLQTDDLLVCEGGEPGRCAVWRGSKTLMTYQKALHRVRVKDPTVVCSDFLAVMIEEFIKAGRAGKMVTGTTIRHLPQEKLREVLVPIPTLEAQRAALCAVDAITAGSSRLGGSSEVAVARSGSLRRALLSAAFSGRLASWRGETRIGGSVHV